MTSGRTRVLIVDDEPSVTDLLSTSLEDDGYRCITAATGEGALKKLPAGNVDVVLLDLRLPGMSGMDVLRQIKSTYPRTAVVVVTGVRDTGTAVEAMKTGAVDYITKPFEIERVSHSIEAALEAIAIWGNEQNTQEEDVGIGGKEVDWALCLDAIAEGVKTRLDSLTGHVIGITIIEQTIDAARCLEIPEEHIEKWADRRRKDIERVKILDHLIEKRN